MDIIFFGTGEFGIKPLEALISAGHHIKLVVTQGDSISGRHLLYKSSPIKSKAKELKLNLYEPENPNAPEALNLLKGQNSDLFIVVDYGHILKEEMLKLPKLYAINIHPSLLPKYRGAAPINWAIANGEAETGVTIIRLSKKMDAGEVILQKKLSISAEHNAITLANDLSELSKELILEVLNSIKKNTISFKTQEDSLASLAPKLTKNDGLINWKNDARSIINRIRAFVPWPTAFTYHQSKLLKIWDARVSDENLKAPGEILSSDTKKIIVGTGKGAVEILELQLEGGKRLSSSIFLCGHKLAIGKKLG